ncbi:hypothetical protein NQ314_010600 [Rhamnusium bicolor]|uniref:DDE-1 domain-containing protein n=1 Tax=Rhamnusium bicolor TaxID=1586634 RepID=A0AAV8XPG1_9CUCU|nr:hypothetical protein NQ314_010600 [Rhamnusium bicolor]
MITGAPPGTAGGAEKTGWVNSEAFMDILKHLHGFVKSTPESPILVIIDNHQSHISISTLEFCKSNGIMLLSLPPHTSGKLQPLDKAVYKFLKSSFNIACNDWMVMNPGKTITIYEIAGLLGIAYPKAFTPTNIINGFRSTGIWPLNRNIFSEEDFLSSSVTDRSLENVLPLEELPQLPAQRSPVPSTSRQSPIHRTPEHSPRHSPPPDSLEFSVTTHQSLTVKPITSTSRFITPVEVRPYPKASARKAVRQNNRKKEKPNTDTPIKDQIIEEIKLSKAKSIKRNVLKGKKKQILSKRIQEDTSESEEESMSIADSDASVEAFSDVELDPDLDKIGIGEYVLLKEGRTKEHDVMSVGKILTMSWKLVFNIFGDCFRVSNLLTLKKNIYLRRQRY